MDGSRDEIFAFARALAGDDADAAVLTAMCGAAAEELESRLRAGVSAEELGERFVAAAGVLALGMYCGVRDVERLKRFQAGNLSVEYAGSGISPEGLRRTAEEMLAAYLADRGFGFLGVPG